MARIMKSVVSQGIYWVEVPEADIYIQCGCPEDSVKHLMKRGFIAPWEKKGLTYESGPNAILLSDVLVQNGKFSNLAEFPVLQMLYRQGMILPGHPNNRGIKPLLIGSEEQVEAQMQYIYRGNYGLNSEEEIRHAGIRPGQARDMMRLKLKFAFGRIRPTKELLDRRIVRDEPVEIRNGVYVERIRPNVFQFTYKDESVSVDLNLAPNESYMAPYLLGVHQVRREYFAVIHTGEGDGWDINRPCMGSILMYQGRIYLIDAGPNILQSLMALGISINEVEGIFHTHAHDDHFAGLTTLMRSDHKIRYYATQLVRTSVMKKLSALLSMPQDEFFHYFEVNDLEPMVWNDIEGLEVQPIFSPHPVETNIFIFRALCEGGRRSYAHFADIVALKILKKMVNDDESAPGVKAEYFDLVKKNYLQPADLKKVDIGGGLIHGEAEDFLEDSSNKIVLSHTSHELSNGQKEIGSGAPFGMVDVLIPAHQDYIRMYAYYFLLNYFPAVVGSQLRMLMNCPVESYNPESIILRRGEPGNNVFLILSGDVEVLRTERAVHNLLSAGALIGEASSLTGLNMRETYRAINFVQVLRISSNLYVEFIKANNLYPDIERMLGRRELQQNSWLFGEEISYPIQNKIALAMQTVFCETGHYVPFGPNPGLYLIEEGTIRVEIDGRPVEEFLPGDFFGEDLVLSGKQPSRRFRALTDAELVFIPREVLLDIPIVRWKLLETYHKRTY